MSFLKTRLFTSTWDVSFYTRFISFPTWGVFFLTLFCHFPAPCSVGHSGLSVSLFQPGLSLFQPWASPFQPGLSPGRLLPNLVSFSLLTLGAFLLDMFLYFNLGGLLSNLVCLFSNLGRLLSMKLIRPQCRKAETKIQGWKEDPIGTKMGRKG